MSLHPRPRRLLLAGMLLLLAAEMVMRVIVYRGMDGAFIIGWPEAELLRYRLTPIAVCVLVGAGLAVSGVLLQALLRNPLASPFVLGLSSGAGLGVVLSMYFGAVFGMTIGGAMHTGPALIGALLVLIVVYALGHRRGGLDPLTLVLVGVVVSAICGALTMFIQQIGPPELRIDLLRWLFGRIPQAVETTTLLVAAFVIGIGVVAATGLGRALDAAMLSDEEARSVGVNLGMLRLVMFMLAGALAAATVAIAGPIAFVGLIAPHAGRLLVGPGHRRLTPIAAAAGVVIVLSADLAGLLLPTTSGRIPVGIFTAIIGGPAFLVLLRRGRGMP